MLYVFSSFLQLWYVAVHHQETPVQSPRLDGLGAFLFSVTPDRCLAWINEGLRDEGRLLDIQQPPSTNAGEQMDFQLPRVGRGPSNS